MNKIKKKFSLKRGLCILTAGILVYNMIYINGSVAVVSAAQQYVNNLSQTENNTSFDDSDLNDSNNVQLDNAVHAYNGENETLDFNANDTITIKVIPKSEVDDSRRVSGRSELSQAEMALFFIDDNDNETQLSSAESINADGSYIMTASASDVMAVVQGLPKATETITLTAKFTGDNNVSSSVYTINVNVSAVAQVIDDVSGAVSYVDSENFTNVFFNYGIDNVKKTVTMIDDFSAEAVGEYVYILINLYGEFTLNLNNHSIECTNNNQTTFFINENSKLTVMDDGEIIGGIGITVEDGGTLDIRGGTIIATHYEGIRVYNYGSLYVSGDVEVKSIYSDEWNIRNVGLSVASASSVSLSGGTFSGKGGAIEYTVFDDDSLLRLLNSDTTTKYAYFHGDTPITENLEADVEEGSWFKLTLTDVVSIKPCTHVWKAEQVSDMTHVYSCNACGSTKAEEGCSYNFNNEGADSIAECACGSVLKVSLTDVENITYNRQSHTPDVAVTLNDNPVDEQYYSVEGYSDNKNAGKAHVHVKVTNTYGDEFDANPEFTILPAVVTVSEVNAADRVYDGTKNVSVTGITIDGKFGDDDVSVDTAGMIGTVGSADAGEYTVINLPELTLTGESKDNYKLTQPVTGTAVNVNILKAQGILTIEDTIINKIFSDESFSINSITNSEGVINYESDNESVAVVSDKGIIDIKGAGKASITVSLEASKNYTASESQKVNIIVAKAETPPLSNEQREYIYALGSETQETINIAEKLPDDRGQTQYSVVVSDPDDILSDVAVDENGKLNFMVNKHTKAGKKASVKVTSKMANYEDAVFILDITLINKNAVKLSNDGSVSVKGGHIFTYGDKLSELEFNSAVFTDVITQQEVKGTLTWKEPTNIPNAGTESAVWIFTPYDKDRYESAEGTVNIDVKKATPYIALPPDAAQLNYGDTLGMSSLKGGKVQHGNGNTTIVEGSFAWKNIFIEPSVSGSGFIGYPVVFTPVDTENYNTVEIMVNPVVNPVGDAPLMPVSKMKVSVKHKKVSDIELPENWQWKQADKEIALDKEKTVIATAIYIGEDKENYKNKCIRICRNYKG